MLLAVILVGCGSGDGEPAASPVSSAEPGATAAGPLVRAPGGVIGVEVVSNDAARARGLMFRESLSSDRGMIFLFPDDQIHGFWMKNTLIPLDLIWIAADGTVAHVESGVPPCPGEPCPTYAPEVKSRHVLELAAGGAERYGIREGTKLVIEGVESYAIE